MAWQQVNDSDVRMQPAEAAMLNKIAGSTGVCADILGNVIGEFRDTIAAAGTPVGEEGTVPDLVRAHVINRTRWLWVCEYPQLKVFQTDGRKSLNDAAVTALEKISTRDLKVPPGDGSPADQTNVPAIKKAHRQMTRRDQEGL